MPKMYDATLTEFIVLYGKDLFTNNIRVSTTLSIQHVLSPLLYYPVIFSISDCVTILYLQISATDLLPSVDACSLVFSGQLADEER